MEIKMDHIYSQQNFGQGWFSYPNLYSLMVQKFPSGSKFVEVGSWKGMSSAYMAVEIINSEKNIEFYCVDHWLGSQEHHDPTSHAYEPDIHRIYEIFVENMNPVKDHYIPLRMSSLEAVNKFQDKSLDFVFIDAAHDYESVKKDILAWSPKLKDTGVLAGHDINYDPVTKAVDEIIGSGNYISTEYCWIRK
jgi:hypothetical protein